MNKRSIGFLSFSHCVNDFLVSVISAILPLLTVHFRLSYAEVGALVMTTNISSSLIQPMFGYLSDRRGSPWLLPFSALALGAGLACLPFAPSFGWLLPIVALNGIGSAAFHPDASRAVYFAASNRRGLSQSMFQIGGNSGMAISALALRFLSGVGLSGTLWFMIPAILSTVLMSTLIRWFGSQLADHRQHAKAAANEERPGSRLGIGLLVAVVTVRSWIATGIMTFVPLFIIHTYGVKLENVWWYNFVFLGFGAAGTMAGGPLADRFGHRSVIRLSVFVSAPLAIFLPYLPRGLLLADLGALGFFLLSTFAVTVVYGQEMLPGNIAMVSGLLIGFAGGVGGIGIMLMGYLADAFGLHTTIVWIMWTMPLAALCTIRLPADRVRRERAERRAALILPENARRDPAV